MTRLRLVPGGMVLDLCCGAGASAIPAARAVGPAGRVLGIDVAAPLLELARARAADEGLANIEFRSGDATRTGLPDGGFDAVVCVFEVFFAADMTAFLREIWRLVRPGGVVAVTTWGPGLFEPANPSLRDLLLRDCGADLGFCCQAGPGGTSVRGYARYAASRRSGTGVPSRSNTRRCSGVGVESFSRRCRLKLTVFLVSVARWLISS